MNARQLCAFLGFACLIFGTAGQVNAGFVYTDNFEAPTLNPFWNAQVRSGSVGLTTSISHGGASSAVFTSTNTTADKSIQLTHQFSSPIYGTASVWMYDTGAGQNSSNYINFSLSNSTTNWLTSLGTYDYGFQGGGPGRGDQYDYDVDLGSGANVFASGVFRSLAWHLFTLDVEPNGLTISIDNAVVYSGPGAQAFDTLTLSLGGPSWRPAWVAYFDDFSVVQSVPEPSSLVLLGAGLSVVLPVMERRRRRRRR